MLDSLDGLFDAVAVVFLLAILVGGVVLVVWLGSLPGGIAQRRRHPRAAAVTARGWLGILFVPFWPVALAWALAEPPAAPGEVRP